MDDMRTMIQDELRQALTRLMPLLPSVAIPIVPIIPYAVDAPLTANVPTAMAIPPAAIILPTTILTDDSKGKPSNSIKVVPTM